MNSFKTLSLTATFATLASLMPTASAEVDILLDVTKRFRQYGETRVDFLDGQFTIDIFDGRATYLGNCRDFFYFSPSIPCPDGATGFIGFGNLDINDPRPFTYYMITSISSAVAVAPKHPDKIILRAAPKTELERPTTGFEDFSYSVFYNISPGSVSIREYLITIYNYERNYTGLGGGTRLNKEIIPGQYIFSLPMLADPNKPLAVPLVYNPIPDGFRRIGNVKTGFRFVDLPGKFTKSGFALIDKNFIPTFKWKGLDRTQIFLSDRLYFSIRFLQNEKDPTSRTIYRNSLFPAVVSGADPRVLLPNALVGSYTLPPLVPEGSRGVVELELLRLSSSNGVTFDSSSRRYQLPVRFVDQYEEFVKRAFRREGSKTAILEDFDGDGFNNLTEWVLESRVNDRTSVPINPVPEFRETSISPDFFLIPPHWGVLIEKRKGLIPSVRYSLEKSEDGVTWTPFNGDNYWQVNDTADTIGVRGPDLPFDASISSHPLPPDAADDLFRVKVVLRKKKSS